MSGPVVKTASEYISHHMMHWKFNLLTMKAGDGGFWTLNMDTVVVSLLLGFFFLLLFWIVAHRVHAGVPSGVQNLLKWRLRR